MPYRIKKEGSGFKVTSPNHPGGFAKHPQSKEMAKKQLGAIYANAGDPKDEGKPKPKKIGVRRKK